MIITEYTDRYIAEERCMKHADSDTLRRIKLDDGLFASFRTKANGTLQLARTELFKYRFSPRSAQSFLDGYRIEFIPAAKRNKKNLPECRRIVKAAPEGYFVVYLKHAKKRGTANEQYQRMNPKKTEKPKEKEQ